MPTPMRACWIGLCPDWKPKASQAFNSAIIWRMCKTARQARVAWSSIYSGAFQNAMMLSPIYFVDRARLVLDGVGERREQRVEEMTRSSGVSISEIGVKPRTSMNMMESGRILPPSCMASGRGPPVGRAVRAPDIAKRRGARTAFRGRRRCIAAGSRRRRRKGGQCGRDRADQQGCLLEGEDGGGNIRRWRWWEWRRRRRATR